MKPQTQVTFAMYAFQDSNLYRAIQMVDEMSAALMPAVCVIEHREEMPEHVVSWRVDPKQGLLVESDTGVEHLVLEWPSDWADSDLPSEVKGWQLRIAPETLLQAAIVAFQDEPEVYVLDPMGWTIEQRMLFYGAVNKALNDDLNVGESIVENYLDAVTDGWKILGAYREYDEDSYLQE